MVIYLSNLGPIDGAPVDKLVELIGDENLRRYIELGATACAALRAEGRSTVVMEDHEQYDPEKLALLIEKQRYFEGLSKVTAAALAYYYQVQHDEAVDMPYGDTSVGQSGSKYSRHKKALQQMYCDWR